MTAPLALHTWTLETTPLVDALRATRAAGWDGVELRRVDFSRAAEKGQNAAQVLALVKASGLRVACVGVELGWIFADSDERRRLFEAFAESCRWAKELGCTTVMSASDRGRGDLTRAAANVREAGDLAASHGVRLAIEFNSQAEQLNNLDVMRGIVARAAHKSCGLLLDTYHLQRSGASLSAIDDVALNEIAYVQYSDVPRTGLEPGKALDRLPPGRGSVPFKEIFALLDRKGYRGFMSYEAPNPAAWSRPAEEVAREALEATRAVLPIAR
jgi:2-keto-myo-inositol isomerase